jgi:hypothetical protein
MPIMPPPMPIMLYGSILKRTRRKCQYRGEERMFRVAAYPYLFQRQVFHCHSSQRPVIQSEKVTSARLSSSESIRVHDGKTTYPPIPPPYPPIPPYIPPIPPILYHQSVVSVKGRVNQPLFDLPHHAHSLFCEGCNQVVSEIQTQSSVGDDELGNRSRHLRAGNETRESESRTPVFPV